MDSMMKRNLVFGAGALVGGWGGAMAIARIGATYGLRLGPLGTVLGGAVGAALGIGISKMLAQAYDNATAEEAEENDESD